MLSSVDSLASSGGGIVIQVLGELSNRDEPSQKFAETFFLAEQPNGYFVLNDIFRYLKEDVESDYDGTDPDISSEPVHTLVEEHPPASNGFSNGFGDGSPSPSEPPTPAKPDSPALDASLVPLSSEHPQTPESTSAPAVPLGTRLNGAALDGSVSADHAPEHNEGIIESLSQASRASGHSSRPPHPTPISGIDFVQSSSQNKELPAVETTSTTVGANPPVSKSWASLAATNSVRWHAPLDQKADSKTNTPPPNPVVQSHARKEAARSFASGTNLIRYFLIV
jgi:hypothetical protein